MRLTNFPSLAFACPICNQVFLDRTTRLQHYQASHPHLFGKNIACRYCDASLNTQGAFEAHVATFHGGYCWTCRKVFGRCEELEDHQRATDHCYCVECDLFFKSPAGAGKHRKQWHPRELKEFSCCECGKEFDDELVLEEHLADECKVVPTGKFACQVCPEVLEDVMALDYHIKCAHGADQRERFVYTSETWKIRACYICQRIFGSARALNSHLDSVKHKPLSNLPCLASSECKKHFVSPSGLLNHLESGSCRSGLNRQKINQLVLEKDSDSLISGGPNDSAVIALGRSNFESSSSVNKPIYTPSESSSRNPVYAGPSLEAEQLPASPSNSSLSSLVIVPTPSEVSLSNLVSNLIPQPSSPGAYEFLDSTVLTPISSPASPWTLLPQPPKASRDGYPKSLNLDETSVKESSSDIVLTPTTSRQSFEHTSAVATSRRCNLCPYVAPSLAALKKHISSAVHAPKLFHCPTALLGAAGVQTPTRYFSTLSGLAAHIESGACGKDNRMLKLAMEFVEGKLIEMGLGLPVGVRLLRE
ncbi:hypothetical protein MMC28_003657 [Mycoblastus sanguinarius]|nr:hypothetical protein [Mycoblastus sanguinarius]